MTIITKLPPRTYSAQEIALEHQQYADFVETLLNSPCNLKASQVGGGWTWCPGASFEECVSAVLSGGFES